MNMQSGGAMLAYSKEGKTLLIAVGKANDDTTLTLTRRRHGQVTS